MSETDTKNGQLVAQAIEDWITWKQLGCRPIGYVWTGKQLAVFEIRPTESMRVAKHDSEHRPRAKSHKAKS